MHLYIHMRTNPLLCVHCCLGINQVHPRLQIISFDVSFSIYNNFNRVISVRQIAPINAHSSHTNIMLHLKQAYKLCIASMSQLVSNYSDEKPFNGEQRQITIFTGILAGKLFHLSSMSLSWMM